MTGDMRNLCWISFIIRHGIERERESNESILFIMNQVFVQEFENGYLTTVQIM